jgi:hypothetical protein
VGVGQEPNHTTARKPGPLLNHSILSDVMVYPLVKLLGIGSTIPRVYKLTVRLPSSDIFSMKKLIYYFHKVYSIYVENMPRQVL